jgi:hypothetical protein
MRWIGIILLVSGFLWIAWDINDFIAYQHAHWMWQSQHLPDGDMVKRAEAIKAMRDLSLSLNHKQKTFLVPALLMLAGGLIAGFTGRSKTSGVVKL